MPEENVIPLIQDINVEGTSLTPKENIIPSSEDINAKRMFQKLEENMIYDSLRIGATVLEIEATATPSPAKTLLKEKTIEIKLRKMNRKCRKLRKIVKKLRKWLEEIDKAWKPKKELATMGTQTDFVTQTVYTDEVSIQTNLIYNVEASV